MEGTMQGQEQWTRRGKDEREALSFFMWYRREQLQHVLQIPYRSGHCIDAPLITVPHRSQTAQQMLPLAHSSLPCVPGWLRRAVAKDVESMVMKSGTLRHRAGAEWSG